MATLKSLAKNNKIPKTVPIADLMRRCNACWLCASVSSNWPEILFPKEGKGDIQIGQRLGLPYLRSLQEVLPVKLPGKLHRLLDNSPAPDTDTNDSSFNIYQDGQGVMAISGVVWDCGLLMTDFLSSICTSPASCCLPPFEAVLDVGCGTGICGISSLYLGAKCLVFTDVHRCDSLDSNIDSLESDLREKTAVIEHCWNSDELPSELKRHWDVLLCSDLWYEAKNHPHLLSFLRQLSFQCALFAYKKRHDKPEEEFFTLLAKEFDILVLALDSLSLTNMKPEMLQSSGLFLLLVIPKVAS